MSVFQTTTGDPQPACKPQKCVLCGTYILASQWYAARFPAAHAMRWQRAELERAKASKPQTRGASPVRPEAASETTAALRAGGAV
jgi:hypothetical protein